ncbi:MAG: hypothetical protein NVS4B11_00740 [Ktedonobacteraceae bacterium]
MALYLTQFTYTVEAWATFTKNPQDRSTVLSQMIQKLGGRLISLYYCFGDYDGVALFEAPDDTTASAVALAALTPGHVKTIKTTKLLTAQEAMEAMRKAGSVAYPGPSRG